MGDITENLQNMSLDNKETNQQSHFVVVKGENEMKQMSLDQVADYISTLRSSIKKLQQPEPHCKPGYLDSEMEQ